MKSKRYCIFMVLLFVTGCDLFLFDEAYFRPLGRDASVLISYEYGSHTSTEINYTISAVTLYFNADTEIYFEKTDYLFSDAGTFLVESLEEIDVAAPTPSSTVFLIDQSGSYLEIDPHNIRTAAINRCLDYFLPTNDFLFGAFSKQGLLDSEPVQYATDGFVSSWDNQEFLFDLVRRTDGVSSLYDAINSGLDKLAESTKPNKHLVVIMHANDSGSSVTPPGLISKAVANNVKIHCIIFGEVVSPSAVWELTHKSNGMLAVCPKDKDVVTVINNLERLLNGSAYVSKLKVKFQPEGGNIVSGNEYETRFNIFYRDKNRELNPVYIKIKIP